MKTHATRTASAPSTPSQKPAPPPGPIDELAARGLCEPRPEPIPQIRSDFDVRGSSMAELLLYGLAFESEEDAISDVLGGVVWTLERLARDLYVEGEHSGAVAELATIAHHTERRAKVALELRRRELASAKAVAS